MENLALEIFDLATKDNPKPTTSKYANLEPDQSITITDTSEIFASGDVWSHSFTLNVFANAHIFGTAGDLHGSRLHEQINKRRARLWVMDLPLYLGYLKLDDEAEVDDDGNVDVSFESGQKTFEDMIEGAKANQVPLMSDVMFGIALWRKRQVWRTIKPWVNLKFENGAIATNPNYIGGPGGDDWVTFRGDGDDKDASVQQYPRMVFPKGEFLNMSTNRNESVNFLNTDYPYSEDENGTPMHPYCNVALCYQKYGYEKKDDNGNVTTDYSGEPEAQRGYEYMPANRVNSAPNFYVIYWLRCLMKHLGIYVEENQMLGVEDLCRLFMVNTKCDYREPKVSPRKTDTYDYEANGGYRFIEGKRYLAERISADATVNASASGFKCTDFHIDDAILHPEGSDPSHIWPVKEILVGVAEVSNTMNANEYKSENSYLHNAYATSECFPDVDISEVIKALESGFGVRFLFSDDFQRVRIVLLRNIFQNGEVQNVSCEIQDEDVKVENNIRGFRMTYGKGKEDTYFYYKGFADKLPHMKTLWPDNSDKHDYSQWNLDADYSDIINKVSAFNKTCYVTKNNGNAYGVKVDKDAKRYNDQFPSLFEFAGYMDAEDGDCSGEKETIEEVTVGFVPAIMNDLNMEAERKGQKKQKFALFVDEKMRPRRYDYKQDPSNHEFNDSDAVYDVDELYGGHWEKDRKGRDYYVNNCADKMSGGIVKPGEFAITSDMYAPSTPLRVRFDVDTDRENAGMWGYFYNVRYDISLWIEGWINEGYRLYLQDNYEPNDDGICPIETHDWGLALGIMRGSGSDAYVNYEADPDDGENNDTWDIEPGSSVTAHPDTCDNYGRLWEPGKEQSLAGRYSYAGALRAEGWNVEGADKELVYFSTHVYITTPDGTIDFICTPATYQYTRGTVMHPILTPAELEAEINRLWNEYGRELTAYDYGKYILAINDTDGTVAYVDGRISLKLRAEKPNPYYDPKKPESSWVIDTKEEAAQYMTETFTTANTNLLARPKVPNATMRAAGWDCPGDGYATVFSIGLGVVYRGFVVHEILWTPIKPDGSVLTRTQLDAYVRSFDNLFASQIVANDTEHLILDIDTTDSRAELLHELQAIYYAEDGEQVDPVVIKLNQRYLEIDTPSLRGRGLADQFYKEYSYWVRNARIVKRTVHMELAQLLSIDKTKKVRVGDVTGFIRKMQYSISNKTGLGAVTMEIMYI